jgi:CRP-like cAMP-binding protein
MSARPHIEHFAKRLGERPCSNLRMSGGRDSGGADDHPKSRMLGHPAFQGVDPGRLSALLARIQPHRVAAGTLVGRPDQQSCNLILEGCLHTYVVTADGNRLVFEIIQAGGIDGLVNVVTGPEEGHFAEAVRPSVVATLPRPVIKQLIDVEPRVAVNLLRLALQRLERREDQLEAATRHQATRRVARMLLGLARYLDPGGPRAKPVTELRPRTSHQVLADMLGLRRETVTAQLGVLRRIGAVRAERNRLVLDRRLLQAVVEGEVRTGTESDA